MSCGRSNAGLNPCERVSRKLFFPVAVSSAVCLLSRQFAAAEKKNLTPITSGCFFFFFFFSDGNPPDKGVCLRLTRRCLFNLAPSVRDLGVCVERRKEERAAGWKRGSGGSWVEGGGVEL